MKMNDDFDFSDTLAAKSDQLNALDLGGERVIRIRDAIRSDSKEQPIWIYFDDDNNRPWKPSLGMRRIIAECWGTKKADLIGKYAQIYCDPTAKWSGKEVGGIRIKAMSDIPTAGHKTLYREARSKTVPYFVAHLPRPTYQEDQFLAAFSAMVDAINSGKMTLQGVIERCGNLSDDQIERLNAAVKKAPI
jgi:hypothetical protein